VSPWLCKILIAASCSRASPSPGAASGFTLISGANFLCAEYKTVSSAQSGLSVGDAEDSDVNGAIADALAGPSPAIDGSAVTATGTGHTLALPGLTTTVPGDAIIVFVVNNFGGTVAVTSPHLVFTRRGDAGASGNKIDEFYAIAPAALSSEVITVNFTSSASYCSACAFAVKGINSGPFDLNASLPATATTAPQSISTTDANAMVIGGFRQNTTAAPGAASGFTLISGANYLASEYKTVTTAQSGLSVGDAQNSDVNGAIADAIAAAPTSGGPGPSASGSFATIDFGVTTGGSAETIDSSGTYSHSGQVIQNTVWGAGGGAIVGDNGGTSGSSSTSGFTIMSYANFQSAMQTLHWPFFRFNSSSEIDQAETRYFEACFGVGPNSVGSTSSPDFTPLVTLIANAANCFSSDCKITFGLGVNPSVTWNTTDYATVCKAFVTYIHNNWPAGAGTVIGWEVGNKNVGSGGGGVSSPTYETYFNTAATAVHSLYPNDLIIGPVSTEFETTLFSSFASACSSNVGAYCYHGYANDVTNHTNGIANIGTGARAYTDATTCRSTVGGAQPIMLGEWNMDSSGATSSDDIVFSTNVGAVMGSCWTTLALNANVDVQYGAVWEVVQDGAYGMIAPTAGAYSVFPVPSSGTLPIQPLAWFLSKAARTLYGNRVKATLVSAGGADVMLIAFKGGPGTNNFGVGVFNYNTTATSGTIGLSHWPVNSSGNGTVSVHTVDTAQNDGFTHPTISTSTVTSGVTGTILFPAQSTVIIYI
jgi:hypothetical protein